MASRKPGEKRDPKKLEPGTVKPPARGADVDDELDVFDAPTEIIERRVNTVPETVES